MDEVVLVNIHDEPTGTMEKMAAHLTPHLHRAFSVFLFNSEHKLLLQQRAFSKYHSAGLWTNTCCSHPKPGEDTQSAAQRRLFEELGLQAEITPAFNFIYQVSFKNGLHEYEYDHVYTGVYDGEVFPKADEVSAYCYKSLNEIKKDILQTPQLYTEWFKIALPKLEQHLSKQQ